MAGRAAYQNKWQSENCDRINLVVKKGEKDRLKAHASGRGESPARLPLARSGRLWSLSEVSLSFKSGQRFLRCKQKCCCVF